MGRPELDNAVPKSDTMGTAAPVKSIQLPCHGCEESSPIGLSADELRDLGDGGAPRLNLDTRRTIFKTFGLRSDREHPGEPCAESDFAERDLDAFERESEKLDVTIEGIIVSFVMRGMGEQPRFSINMADDNLGSVLQVADLDGGDNFHVYYDEADGDIHAFVDHRQNTPDLTDGNLRYEEEMHYDPTCSGQEHVVIRKIPDKRMHASLGNLFARTISFNSNSPKALTVFMENTVSIGPDIAAIFGWEAPAQTTATTN